MRSSEVLIRITNTLNEHNIVWGVGGSYLLFLHGIYNNPQDIDIWVNIDDIDKIRQIFKEYQEIVVSLQLPSKYHFKMNYEGVEVDFVSFFYVVPNQKEFKYYVSPNRIKQISIDGEHSIPCLYLEEWFIIYKVLNREKKASLIEQYFRSDFKRLNQEILEECLTDNTSVQARIKNDVKRLVEEKEQYVALGITNSESQILPQEQKIVSKHKPKPIEDESYHQLSIYDYGVDPCDNKEEVEIRSYLPPMRLIINASCNGKCPFCHHEGNEKQNEMSLSTIEECAKAANQIGISRIIITGGEPTLRTDLLEIAKIIKQNAPMAKVGLTTNGYKLKERLWNKPQTFDLVNLSITSLDKEIAQCYQNVDPQEALEALKGIPADEKNINIIFGKDNYRDIGEWINFCTAEKMSLTVMFELKSYSEDDVRIQRYVLREIESVKKGLSVSLGPTSMLRLDLSNNTTIKIKHPWLSALAEMGICKECTEKSSCFERVCAVRVHPDTTVTPCLNKHVYSSRKKTQDKIQDIYQRIQDEYSELAFLTRNSINQKRGNSIKNALNDEDFSEE